MKRIQPKAQAFTLVEVLVMFCLIVVLCLTVPNAAKGMKAKSRRTQCIDNLKHSGPVIRMSDLYDKHRQTNDIVDFLSPVRKVMTDPKIFHCPADRSRVPENRWSLFSANNISYFFNPAADDTFPQSILSGDSDMHVNGSQLVSGLNRIPQDATISWSNSRHNGSSAMLMGDGSVQQLSAPRLQEAFANTGTNEVVLLAP